MTKEQIQHRIDTLNNAHDVLNIADALIAEPDEGLLNKLLKAIVQKGIEDHHQTIHMCKILRTKGLA